MAKLRSELFLEQSGGGGGGGEGFDVARNGDARVALIGYVQSWDCVLVVHSLALDE